MGTRAGCRLWWLPVALLGCWARASGSCLRDACLGWLRRSEVGQVCSRWPYGLQAEGLRQAESPLMWADGREWYRRRFLRCCCFVLDWDKNALVSARLDCFCWMGEWVSSRIGVGEPHLRAVSSWDAHCLAACLRDGAVRRSHGDCADLQQPCLHGVWDWDQSEPEGGRSGRWRTRAGCRVRSE